MRRPILPLTQSEIDNLNEVASNKDSSIWDRVLAEYMLKYAVVIPTMEPTRDPELCAEFEAAIDEVLK